MGVNGLWIDPIWERGSKDNGYVNFGPNVVEPLLTGTADTNFSAVAAFVQAAHQRNIRVFFDIIVWGTMTNSPLVTEHPEFYTTNSDGTFWQVWGGYGFNWNSQPLQQWYANAAENFILQTGADGFRVDLAPCTSGYFFQTIRTNLLAQGRKIFIMGECPNDRLGTFDTEERSFVNDDYLLTNNIVDVIQSGTGIGTVTGAGQYRYYTANFCNHDDVAPVCDGNRVRFAYGSIFAPFIPMWWIGEEWNNPENWLPVPITGVMYFNTIDWSQLSLPANRSFFEDVKRYIWINRTFPEIFDNFATNHLAANIVKVDTRINGLTNNLQAYARFAAGEAVLVVPNYGTTNGTTVQIILNYSALGLSSISSCRIIDLMTGNEIASGSVSQLSSFTTQIQANYLGVYWLKGSP
jgi:glycosidase